MINLEKTIVLSDFDGTITTFDTNIRLFDKYGDEEIVKATREEFYNGKMDMKTLTRTQFKHLAMSEKEYLDYILTDIELSPGFESFYNMLQKKEIPFKIVSGGFLNGIEVFMNKHGFEEIPIYSNKLVFDGRDIQVKYYDEEYFKDIINKDSYIDCKVEIVNNYRKEYENIVFLGDGSTDIYIADKVDVLFAKDYLARYCDENKIDYIPWEDFHDVIKWFSEKI